MKNKKFILKTSHGVCLAIGMSCASIAFCQNVGINTTGATPASTNMFEVLSTNTAVNTVGIYSAHSGAISGTGYGLWATKTGATTNVGGYFNASGGTNNYALIVPSTGGRIGFGTTAPIARLHLQGSEDVTQFLIRANATQSNTNPLLKLQNSASTDLMWINSDDVSNTFVGLNAGRTNSVVVTPVAGRFNSFIGSGAGYSNTSGNYNTFTGSEAGYNNTSADYNVMIGYRAGYTNATSGYNTFIGHQAGYYSTGLAGGVFIGYHAGYYTTLGDNNTFIGFDAGRDVTTANYGVFVGYAAGANTTTVTASRNSFIGYQAGTTNTTGFSNTFLGYRAGYLNSTTHGGTFIGNRAGYNNVANWNTFVGDSAGVANTSGFYNVFYGARSGEGNTTGDRNTYIGFMAGAGMVTGDRNTFIGHNVIGTTGISNATAIGDGANVTTTNSFVLGNNSVNVGIGTSSPNVKLNVEGGTDAEALTANTGYIITGSPTSTHLAIDNNEIMAKSSGTTTGTLFLQNDGGGTQVGGLLTVYPTSNTLQRVITAGSGSYFGVLTRALYSGSEAAPIQTWDGMTISSVGTVYGDISYSSAKSGGWHYWLIDGVRRMRLTYDGTGNGLHIDGGSYSTSNADVAEEFSHNGTLEEGDVVMIDANGPSEIKLCDIAGSSKVFGVISTNPGVVLNSNTSETFDKYIEDKKDLSANNRTQMWNEFVAEKKKTSLPVALNGRTPCKVVTANNPIRKGDFLTSSSTPGYAEKLVGAGSYFAIALEDMVSGTGKIMVAIKSGYSNE